MRTQMFTGSRPWSSMTHRQIYDAVRLDVAHLEWPTPGEIQGRVAAAGGAAAAGSAPAEASAVAGGLAALGARCLAGDRSARPSMGGVKLELAGLLEALPQ